jgi:polar amino acid transport system permease protein
MAFYLAFTRVSEVGIAKLTRKLSHGQATSGGEALRKAAA